MLETHATSLRNAAEADLESIRRIFNEAIEDRVAALDDAPKTSVSPIVVAENASGIVGWASLSPATHRCADRRPFVLFVCRHNTGRSQMAEAFLRDAVGDTVEVASAGTIAADRPDAGVVAAMAEVGIDISAARPKLLDAALASRADRIITMGCDVEGVPRIDDDWGLPDPKGCDAARVREIRDMVSAKVARLARELGAGA